MKGRLFWFALLFIGISWTANTIYAYSKQLAEPIFLDHYIDTFMPGDDYLTFYYLTNKDDVSHISHVNLGGVTGYIANEHFQFDYGFHFDSTVNLQTFTHHALRSIQVDLNAIELEDALKDGPITFNEIDLFFSNGKGVTASIGEVTILQDYPDDELLRSLGASGSNDNWSMAYYQALESLRIEDVTNHLGKTIKDQLLITINSTTRKATSHDDLHWDDGAGINIWDAEFPYEVKKDDNFYVHTQISPEFIGSLSTGLVFSGTTVSGKSFETYHPLYSQQPYLTQKDVDKLIAEKGGAQ